MKARKSGNTQTIASAKSGMSERTGRDVEKGSRKTPSTTHNWRNRKDPLNGLFENELAPLLEKTPLLSPITLLEFIQERHPGDYPDSVLRTLERRVKKWKALYGPKKEVMFRQEHIPGRLGISDFTTLKNVQIIIKGEPLKHLLFHFRLAFSGWSFIKMVLGGESYTALAEGTQEAFWRLGGSPYEYRTDSLSAAFRNLTKDEQKDITERYDQFCKHYDMKASRNNPGVAHENGSIESPHGHIKRRIQQALLLRGSTSFDSIEDYQTFLVEVVNQHNRRNAKMVNVDREALKPLPSYKAADYTEINVKVTTSSTINVRRVIYTVPSQLQGERLRVHLYHDRLICYLGSIQVIKLNRVHATCIQRKRSINYRDVIHSLVRKPQAFRYSRLRDDLLPTDQYKKIWCHVDKTMPAKEACRFIVGLLKLSAEQDCEEELSKKVLGLIRTKKTLNLKQIEKYYSKQKTRDVVTIIPQLDIIQHDLEGYDVLLENIHIPKQKSQNKPLEVAHV